jgi:RNase P protein component
MLSKKNRADKRTVERIFKGGKFINSLSLTFKFLISPESGRKVSFIAPKSVSPKAVKRNYLRRCGYSILEKYIKQFPSGLMGVFIFKKYQDNVSILENEIKTILHKIH